MKTITHRGIDVAVEVGSDVDPIEVDLVTILRAHCVHEVRWGMVVQSIEWTTRTLSSDCGLYRHWTHTLLRKNRASLAELSHKGGCKSYTGERHAEASLNNFQSLGIPKGPRVVAAWSARRIPSSDRELARPLRRGSGYRQPAWGEEIYARYRQHAMHAEAGVLVVQGVLDRLPSSVSHSAVVKAGRLTGAHT